MDLMADLVEALVATPTHKLTMLPGGIATAEPLTTLVVGKGPAALSLTLMRSAVWTLVRYQYGWIVRESSSLSTLV